MTEQNGKQEKEISRKERLTLAMMFMKTGGRLGWFEFCSLAAEDQDIFIQAGQAYEKIYISRLALAIVQTSKDPMSAVYESLESPEQVEALKLRMKVASSINERARVD